MQVPNDIDIIFCHLLRYSILCATLKYESLCAHLPPVLAAHMSHDIPLTNSSDEEIPHQCGCGDCSSVALAILGSFLLWFVFYNTLLILGSRHLNPDRTIRILAGLHGTVSALLCFISAFILGPWPFTYIGNPPTVFHCNIFILSSGYFLFDMAWCLYKKTEGPLMLLHHAFSLYGFLHVFIFNIYGCEVVAILGSSEFTNPILQTRWFMKEAGVYVGTWAKFIDCSFVFFFVTARIVAGLVLLVWLCLSPRMSFIAKIGGWNMYAVSVVFSVHLFMFIHRKYVAKTPRKDD